MAERAPMAGATKTTLELRQLCNNFLRLCMRSCMNQRFTRMLNISYSQFVTFTMQQLQQSLICATTSFLLHAKNMILFLKLSHPCLWFSPQKAMGSSGSTGSCFGCTLCPLSLSSSSLSSLTARSSWRQVLEDKDKVRWMVLEDKNKLEIIFLDHLQVVIGDSPRIWLDDCAVVHHLKSIVAIKWIKNILQSE